MSRAFIPTATEYEPPPYMGDSAANVIPWDEADGSTPIAEATLLPTELTPEAPRRRSTYTRRRYTARRRAYRSRKPTRRSTYRRKPSLKRKLYRKNSRRVRRRTVRRSRARARCTTVYIS